MRWMSGVSRTSDSEPIIFFDRNTHVCRSVVLWSVRHIHERNENTFQYVLGVVVVSPLDFHICIVVGGGGGSILNQRRSPMLTFQILNIYTKFQFPKKSRYTHLDHSYTHTHTYTDNLVNTSKNWGNSRGFSPYSISM